MSADIPPYSQHYCMYHKGNYKVNDADGKEPAVKFLRAENQQELQHHEYHAENAIALANFPPKARSPPSSARLFTGLRR